MIATPKVVVGVHPIDVGVHPTCPPGWRWCVMVGDGGWDEVVERCANAGWAPDRADAIRLGDTAGVTVCEAMRLLGVGLQWGGVIVLDHDPIPAEADHVPLIDYNLN